MSGAPFPHNRANFLASHLIQECAELQTALTKFQMFGSEPEYEGVQYHNLADARREWEDVQARADEFFAFVNQHTDRL